MATSVARGAPVTRMTNVALNVPGARLNVTWSWQLRPGSTGPAQVWTLALKREASVTVGFSSAMGTTPVLVTLTDAVEGPTGWNSRARGSTEILRYRGG